MKTTDFTPNLTSKQLKESMQKMFGVNVSLEKYDREQLEDMRNKLRTRIFQQEGKAGVNDLLTNETYQKDKAMMALLNTRIKEMLGENIKQLKDKMIELSEAKKSVRDVKETKKAKPDFLDMDKDGNKKEPMKKAVADKKAGPKKGVNPFAKKDESVEEGWDDMKKDAADRAAKSGVTADKGTGKFDKKQTTTGTVYTRKSNTFTDGGDDKDVKAAKKKAKASKESVDTVEKDKEGKVKSWKHEGDWKKADKKEPRGKVTNLSDKARKTTKTMKESFNQSVKSINEGLMRYLSEDEEGKAKAITAAGDMVNDFTSWMQRVGQYQTKTMIELADAIKADFGAAEADAFKQAVGPALSATLETLTQQREAVSSAVAVLAGEQPAEEPMGMEPGMGDLGAEIDPGMDAAGPDEMNPMPAGDEFGAADAAAGAGITGREMRESKFARKLAESHSIMTKLAK